VGKEVIHVSIAPVLDGTVDKAPASTKETAGWRGSLFGLGPKMVHDRLRKRLRQLLQRHERLLSIGKLQERLREGELIGSDILAYRTMSLNSSPGSDPAG
jgi:hypothetical protein